MQVVYTTTPTTTGRRRLTQSATDGLVTYVFKASFAGSEEPVNNALTLVQADPCTVKEWCEELSSVAVLHGSGEAISSTFLSLVLISYEAGSLKFSTAYVEDSKNIGSAAVLLASNRNEPNRGRLITCSTQLQAEGTRLWDCQCYIPEGDTIRLAAVAPNTQDVTTPLSAAIDITAPGVCHGGFNTVGWQPVRHTTLKPSLHLNCRWFRLVG